MGKSKVVEKAKVKTMARSITTELKQAMLRESEGWIDFSILANEAYMTDEWRKLGYENPKEYVQKELEGKVSYEIFMHRVKMGEVIHKYKLTKEEILSVGWSKFREIASLALSDESMERDNLLEIVKQAESVSHRELQDYIRKERSKITNGEVSTRVTLKFVLIDEQDNIVKEALNIACELASTDNISNALVYMAMEFIANHAPSDSEIATSIRESVKKLEKEKAKVTHKPHANKKAKKELEL